MKKILLITALVSLPLLAPVAHAQSGGNSFKPYAAIRAGGGFTKTDVKRAGKGDDIIPVVGAAFGMELPHNLRAEVEYNYRFEAEDTVKGAKTKVTAHTIMVNGMYDFKNKTAFTPYIGGGIGVAIWDAEAKRAGTKLYDDDGFDLAFSGLAGVSYDVNRNIALDLTTKYTYMDAAKGSHNIDALLGMRYRF